MAGWLAGARRNLPGGWEVRGDLRRECVVALLARSMGGMERVRCRGLVGNETGIGVWRVR